VLQRRILLSTIAIAVVVTMLVTMILTIAALTSHANTADRLAAAGDVLVGATLLLAIIAALVALLAYAVSTGPPDLQISVRGQGAAPNILSFRTDIQPGSYAEAQMLKGFLDAPVGRTGRGIILLRNQSRYSANNPAVIVRFHNMGLRLRFCEEMRGWVVVDDDAILASALQWDGGPTYSIHGHSTRRLPELDLKGLLILGSKGQPALTFEMLADGYRRGITLLAEFYMNGKTQFPQNNHEIYFRMDLDTGQGIGLPESRAESEHLRQAAARQRSAPTTTNDLSARSSHRGITDGPVPEARDCNLGCSSLPSGAVHRSARTWPGLRRERL